MQNALAGPSRQRPGHVYDEKPIPLTGDSVDQLQSKGIILRQDRVTHPSTAPDDRALFSRTGQTGRPPSSSPARTPPTLNFVVSRIDRLTGRPGHPHRPASARRMGSTTDRPAQPGTSAKSCWIQGPPERSPLSDRPALQASRQATAATRPGTEPSQDRR